VGAPVVLVAVQLSVEGLYRPPVLNNIEKSGVPPQTIIWLSAHIAVCSLRAWGAPVVLVVVQLSVLGLYRPPLFK